MQKNDLGTRMKTYEGASQTYLTRRTPVIIRIDGRAFHSYTRKMERPFDKNLSSSMAITTSKLVERVEGCVFGYCQSDEISLLLIDYQTLDTQAWFKYRKSKVESISASIATAYFNSHIKTEKLAEFDSRSFNLPKEEVVNYFVWRQNDCSRNSVQMLGQANFSHKQLHNKSCNDIQDMLFKERSINWNNISTSNKRGIACYKIKMSKKITIKEVEQVVERNEVYIDFDIPIFMQDRNFIQKYVDV